MKKFESFGPFVNRLMLGGGIFTLHGWGKMADFWNYLVYGQSWGFIELVSFMPILPPVLWAIAATLGEFFAGLAVLIGYRTRWGAAVIGIIMIVAILGVQLPGGDSIELPLVYLALAISLILTGPGRLSIRFQP